MTIDKTDDDLGAHVVLARKQLGTSIQALRQVARLKQDELAPRALMSQGKLSKIERGVVAASEADVRALLEALKPAATIEQTILAQFDLLAADEGDRRAIYLLGIADKQRKFQERERTATRIRVFDTSVIPGLLQTLEYARTIVAALASFSPKAVTDAVGERMGRQAILRNRRKSFEFVILEAALWSHTCPDEVRLAQLKHLRTAIGQPNIRFGIVPAGSPLPNVINAFWMFDENYVSAETIASEVIAIGRGSIREYVRTFNELTALASYGSEADEIVGAAIETLERRTG